MYYFDRFDICEAYMLAAIEWGEYALFDRLTRKMKFKCPNVSYSGMSENAQEIFHALNDRLLHKYYGANAKYVVIYNTPGYLSNDISDRYDTLSEAWADILNNVDTHGEEIEYCNSYTARLSDGNIYEIQPVDYDFKGK